MYLPPSIPSSTCTCISLTLLTLPPTALLHHHYIPTCTCLPVCLSAPRHSAPHSTVLHPCACHSRLSVAETRMGNSIRFFSGLELRQGHTHTHTHTPRHAFASAGDRTEKELLLHRLVCTYLLVGTYMLSIVEPPSTTPFITSFPSPHRAARRADGRHSTRKPSTTTPVRLVHLSHRWSGRPAIRRYAHIIMG